MNLNFAYSSIGSLLLTSY